MSLVGEVLEVALGLVLDSVRSWRRVVALAVAAILVWLILDFGPQNAMGTAIAVVVAIAGVVLGGRWARAAQEG
ncbi:hypothetical protein [Lysobacter arvi]|uniref:Uncharacterized protein n=1 Tax=Lysobacter arvi TaxID=3038776 RepID=A0ABU1C9G6_9GAMM|nr:hypothetical protein [Lysobacter arvi]MDR0181833.1 hypothetical protein [Lysobacter arvi]